MDANYQEAMIRKYQFPKMEIILLYLQEFILLAEISALILLREFCPGMSCWDENENLSLNLYRRGALSTREKEILWHVGGSRKYQQDEKPINAATRPKCAGI